jgi:HK97 family phage major capsid protein
MATLTTSTAAYPWRPDETFFAANEVVGEALILQTSTVAGSIDGDQPSVRVAYVNDAESANYVNEASAIPEDDPELAEVLVHTKKLARLVNLSNEQFRQPQTAAQLAQSVSRDLIRKADRDYIGGTSPLVGLANIAGTVEAGSVNTANGLDTLVDLIATLESNGAMPSHIIVDPLGWSILRKIKTDSTDSNESLLGAGVTDAQPMLLSLPVLRSRFVPAYTGVVVDRNAVVSAIGPVSIATSEHALFGSDGVQLRALWRIGWNVTRPDWIGSFDLEPGT